MADNVTTYTTVVDVEVKGADEVKDLGDKTEEADGKFKSLRSQIRETTVALQKLADEGKAGTKEFQNLSDKLDDLGDAQKKVAFQSGQIEDKLAALPGPIGQIGKGFSSLKDSVDTFGKTLTISLGVVGLLVAAFFAIKEALTKTKEGQEGLSKAMSAFNDVLAPLFAILEKVGLIILPIVTKGFEVLGSVMSKVAGFFGATNDKIKEVKGSLEENNEYAKKLAEDEKARIDAINKKKAEDLQKHKEWLAKKKAADDKAAAEKKKKDEEDKKNLEDANKVLVEAYLTTIADRDKEIYKRGEKLNADILALTKAGYKDLTSVKEAYYIEIDKINKKYDDEAAKKIEEENKKKADEAQKAKDEAEKLAKEQLDRDNILREDKANLYQSDYDLKRATNDATYQDELNLFDKTRELGHENLVVNKASNDAIAAYDKQTAAVRIQIEKAQQAAKLAVISDALGQIAEAVGAQTTAGKALAIAQATINTYLGATQALATYPPPFGAIAAGTVILAGLLQVKKIVETKLPPVPLPGGGQTSGGGGTSNAPSMAAPSIPTLSMPGITATGGTNPTQQIANTLAGSTNRPIKAYVVSGDVSSQQALDRRTTKAATF
jgi:hypothetical protein